MTNASWSQVPHFIREEVEGAIRKLGVSKSPGPVHWRFLMQIPGVPDVIVDAFNELLGTQNRRAFRELYAFRMALIPKDNGGYRPVVLSESIIVAFHKLLLTRFQAYMPDPSQGQLAFISNAHAVGIRRAYDAMQAAGAQALTLDIQNAFNSIPRDEILNGLDAAQVPRTLRNYVASFLQLRHGLHLHEVPQGDPLSMLLYCLGHSSRRSGVISRPYSHTLTAFSLSIMNARTHME